MDHAVITMVVSLLDGSAMAEGPTRHYVCASVYHEAGLPEKVMAPICRTLGFR
jgi:hypothetical protein